MSTDQTLPTTQTRPLIIAHRGASLNCPENTIPAFEAAITSGADAVELDVRWTADNHAVVVHDAAVFNDGRKTAIRDLSLSELNRLSSQRKAPIPTLLETLQWGRDKTSMVFDIKDLRHEEDLIRELATSGFPPRSVISSFRLTVIGRLKALRPEWATAWIIGRTGPALLRRLLIGPIITRALRWGATALHFNYCWINPELLKRCRQEGLKVAVWTVDDEPTISRLAAMGVDAIITNAPDVARRVLRPDNAPPRQHRHS